MVTTIADALGRIKQELARVLEPAMLTKLCREVGHQWRERLLDPVTTIHLFILQVLHGNTACAHVPRLAGKSFTGSAYCQARGRLPLKLFQKLLTRVVAVLAPLTHDVGRWLGHRTFFLDGSSFSMPDTEELQKEFGQHGKQKPGCGFPVAHLLVLFHAGTGLLLKALASPLRTHDMRHAAEMHPELAAGDVLIADRGLCSFAHLALVLGRKLHALFRMHQQVIVNFTLRRPHVKPGPGTKTKGLPRSRWVRRLGRHDQIVEWFKPVERPQWMTTRAYAALPASIRVRELRFRVNRPGFRVDEVTLVTTLLDAERYTAAALAELYGMRWQVETNLSHLKRTLGMDVLRCETVRGVKKELLVFALVYNLVRAVMLEASRRQEVPLARISFIDALRWLATARPGADLPDLVINPHRPNRVEPRQVKRRPKSYSLLTKPRDELRKALLKSSVKA
jgi:hypothetical protein